MQPKGICQSAEAREAGLSLDLALAGRIKAGEQAGRSLTSAVSVHGEARIERVERIEYRLIGVGVDVDECEAAEVSKSTK
jgi:hypothetical protein